MVHREKFLDFQLLKVPQLNRSKATVKAYRVYKDAEAFEIVEAETSQEAIEKSGVKEPYLVQHLNLRMEEIIESTNLNRDGEGEFPIPSGIQDILEKRKKIAVEQAADENPAPPPAPKPETASAHTEMAPVEETAAEAKEETPSPAPDATPETEV